MVVTLIFAVQGAYETRAEIANTFEHQARIQEAQLELEGLLRLQIDEENSLRGYLLTRDPFYIAQYRQAAAGYDAREAAIRTILRQEGLRGPLALVAAYGNLQSRWRHEVARPLLLARQSDLVELDKRNKLFSDYETRIVAALRRALGVTSAALGSSTQEQIDRSAEVRAFWVTAFGLLALLFNAYRTRLYRELERERAITETLQQAFRSESMPLPHCEVGSAYLSATSHMAVGGDVFDVYRLSSTRALVLIADISGKGVDAAVLTAFIKFMIRAIALRQSDPAAILAEFNVAFLKVVGNPYLFVSMFVGILDTETFRLDYASAGHDCAYLRRDNEVRQLAVTGPVVGVMEESFDSKTLDLNPGDMLVLATDGLTEVRNRRGTPLLGAGAMKLIEAAGPHAQQLADQLIAQVKARGRRHRRDDVAILAIRMMNAEPARV